LLISSLGSVFLHVGFLSGSVFVHDIEVLLGIVLYAYSAHLWKGHSLCYTEAVITGQHPDRALD
jgi:hypothetical protein